MREGKKETNLGVKTVGKSHQWSYAIIGVRLLMQREMKKEQ